MSREVRRAATLKGALALLAFAFSAAASASPPAYETVPLPPGGMVLQLPLDSFFENSFLAVTVTVAPGLRFGRYEVSRADYQACAQAGACDPSHGEADAPGHPVVRVDWQDAMDYAAWLSAATGRHLRLPTEREWYYAFSMGRDLKLEARQYDYADLAAVKRVPSKTWPRGKFGENAWGIADLLGNVWEWTLSCYTLSKLRLLAEPDLERLAKAEACSTRIVGGESRAHVPDFVRDTYGGGCATVAPASNLGIRLVEEVKP